MQESSIKREATTTTTQNASRTYKPLGPHYKWIALSNTTLGVLMATINGSIVLISLPAIFSGIGINQIAAILGSIIGLILGGVLAVINWRVIFLVSVPIGLFGTVWAYLMLRETATIRAHQKIDWAGNITFAGGLTILLVGITYGIQPYGTSSMGWTNPLVLGAIGLGILLLALFVWIELRVSDPMFHLGLFKIRMFTAGNISGFLAAVARGGLQFMLIIWLQGIWLP